MTPGVYICRPLWNTQCLQETVFCALTTAPGATQAWLWPPLQEDTWQGGKNGGPVPTSEDRALFLSAV